MHSTEESIGWGLEANRIQSLRESTSTYPETKETPNYAAERKDLRQASQENNISKEADTQHPVRRATNVFEGSFHKASKEIKKAIDASDLAVQRTANKIRERI